MPGQAQIPRRFALPFPVGEVIPSGQAERLAVPWASRHQRRKRGVSLALLHKRDIHQPFRL